MIHRRHFLGALTWPVAGFAAPALLAGCRTERALQAFTGTDGQDPQSIARDEARWREVQQAFTCDRSVVNLNNGGVCPAPDVAQAAMKRHLDFANEFPSHHLWQILEPRKESVRDMLAKLFGCDREEIAITRNASESLENCQMGFDLEPGDEVLCTNQDYPRMITAFQQRERRDGIKLVQFSIPVPCEDPSEIVRRYAAHIGPRTRMILMCHVINLTGQVLPVREVCALGRQKGIPVIVDGAHAFANLDFRHADLECDYYGTSLHKWLYAPHGTGMLFVRRERIAGVWPLMAAPAELDGDVRKFEEIGTHPAANFLAIAESLAFHFGIGPANKAARLIYLRDRWAEPLARHARVHFNTSFRPGFANGNGNLRLEGLDTLELQSWLWAKHRIYTVAIVHPDFNGLRVTPSVHNTLEELERFVAAIEEALEKGLAS